MFVLMVLHNCRPCKNQKIPQKISLKKATFALNEAHTQFLYYSTY